MTSIYIPKEQGHKYTLGSVVYKYVDGRKQFYRVCEVHYTGFRSKETHIKFKAKKIK